MNDAFLPGNGFDTYEEQDRVLMGLSGSVRSGVAVRILQHRGNIPENDSRLRKIRNASYILFYRFHDTLSISV